TIIGVIDSSGALSQAGSGFYHRGIAAGGESMWVTANFGRLEQFNTSSRALTRLLSVPANGGPDPVLGAVTVASDGAVWFADGRADAPRLGRMTFGTAPGTGTVPVYLFVPLWADAVPQALVAGDNGSVWFTSR